MGKAILKPFLFVLAGLSAAIFVLSQFVSSYAGQAYFDNAWDRMALRRIAHPFDLVPVALTAHRARHSSYPPELEQMDATVPSCASALSIIRNSRPHRLGYQNNEDRYGLYIKINWDASLIYSSDAPHWIYEPGNGDPSWPID